MKGRKGETKFQNDYVYLAIYSINGANLTIYHSFNREAMQIRKEKEEDDDPEAKKNYVPK